MSRRTENSKRSLLSLSKCVVAAMSSSIKTYNQELFKDNKAEFERLMAFRGFRQKTRTKRV